MKYLLSFVQTFVLGFVMADLHQQIAEHVLIKSLCFPTFGTVKSGNTICWANEISKATGKATGRKIFMHTSAFGNGVVPQKDESPIVIVHYQKDPNKRDQWRAVRCRVVTPDEAVMVTHSWNVCKYNIMVQLGYMATPVPVPNNPLAQDWNLNTVEVLGVFRPVTL